jgi:hypothetical protein
VFGVSSDEYLNYAEQNLAEWKAKGEQVVEDMVRSVKEEYGESCNGESEFVDEPIDEPETTGLPMPSPEESDESDEDDDAGGEEEPLVNIMDASTFSV